ncbi:MAG: hypothetical protein ACJ746_21310 [Bryobacteraceae bacterium]
MTFPESIHFAISEAIRFITPVGVAFEWLLLALFALAILVLPANWAKVLLPLKRAAERIASSRRIALLSCAILPVAIRLLVLPVSPVPDPSIHDEFSQLLLGDTLAHGRLTNPTPAMWQHFESIHIIQKPTYNSMYPPGHGVFLAFGQALFHEPWVGVEVAIALMCAAMYWMFEAWLPASWAFFGTLLAIFKLTLTGFWVDSYISAAVPTIGGALIVGAVPRFRNGSARKMDALLFGLGAVILMNTRPFEGAILTILALGISIPALLRRLKAQPRQFVFQLAVPAVTVLALGVAGLGYYCYRVAGKPTLMPYQVNRRTYGWPENLAFLRPLKVSVRDPVLKQMYTIEVAHHEIYNSPFAIIDNLVTRLFDNWAYLIGPVLTLPLLFGLTRCFRRTRYLICLFAGMIIVNLFQLLLYPYHLAPIVPVLFCLIAFGVQHLYEFLKRISRARSYYLVTFLPIAVLLTQGLKLFSERIDIPQSSYWERGYEWQRDARADITRWLSRRPGKHLVIVHYASNHPVNQEWVYNGADLAGSKIVWAREVSDSSDRELLNYYKDRHAWLVQADVYPQQVVPYPFSAAGGSSADLCAPKSALPDRTRDIRQPRFP